MEKERVYYLLRKTLATLEEHYEMSIFDCDLADEIGITTEEYNEIMNFDAKTDKEERFMVQMEWAFDGDHDVESFIFADEAKAQAKFNEIKAREVAESWIADGNICENDNPEDDDIIIETDNDSCFTAYIYGRECETHTRITLSKVKTDGEVKTND